jgi:hypothetical protein
MRNSRRRRRATQRELTARTLRQKDWQTWPLFSTEAAMILTGESQVTLPHKA